MIISPHRYIKNCVYPSHRLIMVILAKNEDDIIEYNIRFHSKRGVDAFIVMDNHSTDNTSDILRSLQSEYDLTVINQSANNYQQKKWMGQLIHQAGKLGASWVIPNDADEFWIPKDNFNLKKTLRPQDSTITLHRSNILLNQPDLGENSDFYKITKTIAYSKEQERHDDHINIMFANISPKVIVNPNGFIKISGGNHRATHIANLITARESSEIEVLHLPIRSWNRFEANIKHREKVLSQCPDARMGEHYKRWVRMLREGILDKEFDQFFMSQNNLNKVQGQVEKINFPLFTDL